MRWRRDGRLARKAVVALSALAVAAPLVLPYPAQADSPSTLDPHSDSANAIADLWWFMLIVSTVVVAVVLILVLLATLRRRRDRERPSGGLRRRLGGEAMIAVGGVVLPLAILAVLFGVVLGTMDVTASSDADPELRVEVTGRQWFWDVSYPGTGAQTANEIHIPAGEPVTVELRSADVIHSFWVPELDRKVDMIPGRTNELTLEANEPGIYRGQCAEFCGLQHANMAFLVIAEEPDEFDEWLEQQSQPASPPATESARSGQEVFMGEGCAACHTIRGTEAQGDVGPDLTHLALRETIAAVTLENTRGDLGGWVLDPQHIKPGNEMPATNLSGEQLQHLLDYLQGLR